MDFLNINVPQGTKIAVIADSHGHNEQFQELIAKINPSDKIWAISLGDIKNKGFGIEAENSIIHILQSLNQPVFACKGNNELKAVKLARENNQMTPELEWLDQLPVALSFNFDNGTRLTCCHGGVLPRHTWDDLKSNIEVCFVRNINKNGEMCLKDEKGVNWHEIYNARLGYMICGHSAQRDGIAKFYKYSCNIDTCVYNTGILSAQVFSEKGKEELIQVKGKAFTPEIINIENDKKIFIPSPLKKVINI